MKSNVHKYFYGIIFTILLPLVVFILSTFIYPRPYFISATDLEHDFYYQAKLLSQHFPLYHTYHPGTPIYYLVWLFYVFMKPSFESLQMFFNSGYGVLSLLNILALIFFFVETWKKEIIGFSVLAVSFIISYPSFLTYSNYVGTDAFTLIFGLPVLTVFWKILKMPSSDAMKKFIFCGIGLGLCLATKFTFVPVFLSFLGAAFIYWFRHSKVLTTSWIKISILSLITLVSFIFFVSPIIFRVNLGALGDAKIPSFLKFISDCIYGFIPHFWLLSLIIFSVFVSFIFIVGYFYLFYPKKKKIFKQDDTNDKSVFDHVTAIVFITLLLLAFGYTLVCVIFLSDVGVSLRNTWPSSFSIPFAIILIGYLLISMNVRTGVFTWLNRSLIFISCFVVFQTFTSYFSLRNNTFNQSFMVYKETKHLVKRIIETMPKNGVIAFFDGSPGYAMGEASFYYWGNRYAAELFDSELSTLFPYLSWFRLREWRDLQKLVLNNDGKDNLSENGFLNFLRQTQFYVDKIKPLRYPFPERDLSRISAVEKDPNRFIYAVLLLKSELNGELSPFYLDKLKRYLDEKFNLRYLSFHQTSGEEWMLISMAPFHK